MQVSPDYAASFPSKEDFLRELLSTSPSFTSLSEQITTTSRENIELKQQVQDLQLKLLSFQSKSQLYETQEKLREVALEQSTKQLQQQFEEQYLAKIENLQKQITLLCQEYQTLQQTHHLLQNDHQMSQIYLESLKSAYNTRAQQLYIQLHKYQAADSVKIAKEQVELNSRAYLVIDKLGSQAHLDTIQQRQHGNTHLVNVTQTTQSLASKGEHSEVLCTRDQVRLVLTGKLHDLQAFGDIRWYRAQHGSQFLQIPNAGGRSRANATIQETYGASLVYVPTVDDLYCTLRCQFVDPVTGATLVTEIGPVVPDKDLLDSAVDGYKRGEVEQTVGISDSDIDMLIENEQKFEKLSKEEKKKDRSSIDKGVSQNNISVSGPPNFLESLGMGGGGGTMSEYKLTLSNKKIIITGKRNGKKINIKHALDANIYIAAHSDTEVGFSIYLYNNWVNCSTTNRHQRDIILALTRLYCQQSRINDLASESEKLREKQYSSAWMLSLINSEHDTLCSMPKSKIASSQMISITVEELNVGNLLLQPKLQACGYQDGECFIDVLQTPFKLVMDVLEDEKEKQANETVSNEVAPQAEGTSNDEVCVWVTRKEFEYNAILHTQSATLDHDPHKKKQFAGQRARSALSNAGSRVSFSSSVLQDTAHSNTPRLANAASLHDGRTRSTTSPTSSAVVPTAIAFKAKTIAADEEYIPYDIDDVTPQLGQGKRGFDDIVIGGDSDEEDEHGNKIPRIQHAEGGAQGEHGIPLFEIKIKEAHEVKVDTAANSAKIKQMFTNNVPPTPGINTQNTMGGGGGRRGRHSTMKAITESQPPTPTTTTSTPTLVSPVIAPSVDQDTPTDHSTSASHEVSDISPAPSPAGHLIAFPPNHDLPPTPTLNESQVVEEQQKADISLDQPVILEPLSPIQNGRLFDESELESVDRNSVLSQNDVASGLGSPNYLQNNASDASLDFADHLTQLATQAEVNKDDPHQVSFEVDIQPEGIQSSLVDESDDDHHHPSTLQTSPQELFPQNDSIDDATFDNDFPTTLGQDHQSQGAAIDESTEDVTSHQ